MKDPEKYLEELKTKGLDPQREERFRAEIAGPQRSAEIPPDPGNAGGPFPGFSRGLYAWHDLAVLQDQGRAHSSPISQMKALDELLERDRQREKDGFPRKIKVGRLVKPGKGGKGKIVVVPSTEEEKFVHDPTIRPPGEGAPPGAPARGTRVR